MPEARRQLEPKLLELVDTVSAQCPEHLGALQSQHILFVAAAARRRARATIRPLYFAGGQQQNAAWQKPIVYRRGQRQRYEIALRPAFFLRESATRRLQIILHELWHIDQSFDGSLDKSRRHDFAAPGEEQQFIGEIIRQLSLSESVRACLSHQGELVMPAWLHRPPTRLKPNTEEQTTFDEADLYPAIIEQTG